MLKRKAGNPSNTLTKAIKLPNQTKYKQKTLSQTLDPPKPPAPQSSLHPQVYAIIASYLKEYQKRVLRKSSSHKLTEKSFVIQGSPGCGKTYFVRQLGTDFKLKLLEINASSTRSRLCILKLLGEASQTFSIDKGENSGTIIFIDDVDIILEPDQGFYKGIENIISDNKCPVIMTCQVLPKFLQSLNVKIYNLDSYENNKDMFLRRLVIDRIPSLTTRQIENLIIKAKSDMNIISNNLLRDDLSSAYGADVSIQSELAFTVLNAESFFSELWAQYSVNICDPELLCPFHDVLSQMDLLENTAKKKPIDGLYRVQEFHSGIEKIYLKHRDTEEEFHLKKPEKSQDLFKIARENLVQMGDTDDFISYLQVLKEFPVVLHPSYLLRQSQKNKSTYFDIFLQKNPNQFNPS